jgi:Sec-independent protein secretion pathway component TatC
MDLEGNILTSREDPGADIYNRIRYNWAEFTSSNNNTYKLTDFWGWTRIVRNDAEVVYQIDPLSYTVKVLLFCSVVSAFAFVLWLLKAFVKPKIDSDNGKIFL